MNKLYLALKFKIMNKFKTSIFLILLLYSCGPEEETTESGLKYTVLQEGEGNPVEKGKEIHAHCVLTLEDGKEIWSTRQTEPFVFVKGETTLIPGFEEATGMMQTGDRFRVVIPPELGYGSRGAGDDIPPNATLIFDIEIMNVEDPD